MSTTSIIAIVACFVVTFGIATPLMIKAYLDWKKQAALWRALATKYGVVSYLPPAMPLDTGALARALELALESIMNFGPWDRARVLNAVGSLRIELNTVDEWITLDGQKVGGQSLPENGIIRIGPKMLALCHEICHTFEWVFDRRVDYLHAAWSVRGIQKAVDTYEAAIGA